MTCSDIVSLERLQEQKYGEVLCYPRYDLKELQKRLRELRRLGVREIEFAGEKRAFNVPVLGKGCIGIVVAVHTDKGKVALKIRRVDADRAGMRIEAEMLKMANAVRVGPRLISAAENFLLMEFIEGTLLPRWVEELKGKGTRDRIRKVLHDILDQCWRLDEAGLDHGELSRAPKHIIVGSDNKPVIVDFETASVSRRASNVTSICQYLFIGSQTAKMLSRKLGEVDKGTLIEALRAYKRRRTRENFNKILTVCRLQV